MNAPQSLRAKLADVLALPLLAASLPVANADDGERVANDVESVAALVEDLSSEVVEETTLGSPLGEEDVVVPSDNGDMLEVSFGNDGTEPLMSLPAEHGAMDANRASDGAAVYSLVMIVSSRLR